MPIEWFRWHPQKEVSADFADSDISGLSIHAGAERIELVLREKPRGLLLNGNLWNIDVIESVQTPALHFFPRCRKRRRKRMRCRYHGSTRSGISENGSFQTSGARRNGVFSQSRRPGRTICYRIQRMTHEGDG
jgi:hypothetical protein